MLARPARVINKGPGFLRRNWIYIYGTLLFIVFNGIYMLNNNQGVALVSINKFRSPFWDVFFKITTRFAEPVAYLAILIIVTAFSYRKGIFAVVAGTTAGVVSALLKYFFSQPRPMRWLFDNQESVWHSLQHFEENYRNWSETSSFPSGHATSAFALYGFLAFNARQRQYAVHLLCLFIALLVALSRMYLLYHFLRDVTAGAFLGLLIGILIHWLQQSFFPDSLWLGRGWLSGKRGIPVPKAKVPPEV